LSLSHQTEEAPQFFTRAGLAAEFGISERTIEEYIACDAMPPALGRHPNGFNYDYTHYRALAKKRAELAARIPLTRRRKRRPHIVIRASREMVSV
jgi:hypothetical protein